MTNFQIYPAIDLRDGKCVRLFQGDYAQETIYGDSPVDMAKKFVEAGAQWIHMVDLDGAKDGVRINDQVVIEAAKLGAKVQVGGGIRTREDIQHYLSNGVARVIIGSLAIRNPELAVSFIEEFGADRIVIGIDAKNGMAATEGWIETSGQAATEVANYFASKGAKHFIYTDIATDGTLAGPNIKANQALVEAEDAQVIVSGGIGSLEDIRNVKQASSDSNIAGVIIGKALYENRFTLEEALSC
ncbi:1-(5-phosphoribosyl)-5-[(5-phosphoribosylamino)methylideneamino]imidazole-4-carboxamide isomerase [Microbacterium sp. APC 3898]|uniref:1-(5-phosphoribosyl)-5-[(5-phosphoribosylamino)methylideneamino] imidazole-4-carboxamide isomerase n=1 Tax=Planococcus notacanthi TaxID=3035188 RepID=A0ABT7ZNV4_9BACL|nr:MULTISPECIES: 1-(5-phosphoribosyl)-5-[(5-phosphoribosylamino)methylideneamino]imidazole-4-carboxamide isomerase [Terrabacteria group]MDN3428768.1 1-(5-phosphoribosyl)-5-[(5-phosphoribosylamino)methylideneamino]imidazole-4-carboxamide isomerase [Planococcus sp. APC 4016]MDN3439283.1 1-(5-phosphoribosyl)-5-[(5-phosphoribosylamino)methylideneamino]imidazole-4-carboxamide isomerase [Planococcus sp. APC 3900]MDN3500111.1 1-(5-phosphoribosyl)-5-[(5-phosphoribosylamino)methylideneamino]imidazole-4-c